MMMPMMIGDADDVANAHDADGTAQNSRETVGERRFNRRCDGGATLERPPSLARRRRRGVAHGPLLRRRAHFHCMGGTPHHALRGKRETARPRSDPASSTAGVVAQHS